jgi:uncharacterized protein YbjT (DUF2867 family)
MAPPVQGRKIAFIGASGNIGTPVIRSLLEKKDHTITAIQRSESTATFAPEVVVKKGAFDDEAFLVDALTGQDVVIIILGMMTGDLQSTIIAAAVKAKVPYVLPTEFGSDMNSKLADEFFLVAAKKKYRQQIEESGVSSFIAVITNPWLEFNLATGLLGIDLKERTVFMPGGGNTKLNLSSLSRVGEATAALLSLPEADLAAYKNKPFYVSSFHVTQRELFASVQRATKTTEADWKVSTPSTEEVWAEHGEALKKQDQKAFFAIFLDYHVREGYGGDFNDKVDLSKFDFEKEDLDEAVARTVAQATGAQ